MFDGVVAGVRRRPDIERRAGKALQPVGRTDVGRIAPHLSAEQLQYLRTFHWRHPGSVDNSLIAVDIGGIEPAMDASCHLSGGFWSLQSAWRSSRGPLGCTLAKPWTACWRP